MNENLDANKANMSPTEKEIEKVLRPLSFDDFTGQKKVVENLKIFVLAASQRGESLDHVLLHGPPGLGKTTLANIIANELQVGFKVTSGPVLEKPGDLAGLLTNLEEGDVLFIDEIHRLSPVVEEYLYSAEYKYSSTTGDKRWISSINNTSPSSKFVNKPAKSPGFSNTGPEVTLKPTCSSLAIILANVVFPNPGGPCSKT